MWLWNYVIARGRKNFENRKSLDCLKQTVSRNRYAKDSASEGSGKKKLETCYWKLEERRFLLYTVRKLR